MFCRLVKHTNRAVHRAPLWRYTPIKPLWLRDCISYNNLTAGLWMYLHGAFP